MPNSDERASVLAHIAYRHVAARRQKFAEEVALRILNDTGSVSVKQVASALEAEWVEPDPQTIADHVAAKCLAAVDYHELEVAAAELAASNAAAKVAKFEALLAAVKADAKAIAKQADVHRDQAAKASELLELAARAGNAASAKPGPTTKAAAEVATATGKVG